jgi:hypothetical protein
VGQGSDCCCCGEGKRKPRQANDAGAFCNSTHIDATHATSTQPTVPILTVGCGGILEAGPSMELCQQFPRLRHHNQYRPMLGRSRHASELQALMHVVAIMSREAILAAAMLRSGEWFRQNLKYYPGSRTFWRPMDVAVQLQTARGHRCRKKTQKKGHIPGTRNRSRSSEASCKPTISRRSMPRLTGSVSVR